MPISLKQDAPHGADYLQRRIDQEFPLARHIGIVVESAHAGGVVLRAPFAPNVNDKGTAFGGSLFCVAVLAGWAWLTRDLAARQLDAGAVIQESTIRYLVPAAGELRATLAAPSVELVEKFHRMLHRGGRGRIRLHVDIHDGRALATQFDGTYAAVAATRARKLKTGS
jgi:thioesterase domain-containing protein